MSRESDIYEAEVAGKLNKIKGVSAKTLTGDTSLSDVFIKFRKKESWLEVKMNHSDNLFTTRISYEDGEWKTTYKGEGAKTVVALTNESALATEFVKNISEFTGIPLPIIRIPTTVGGLKIPGAVPYIQMQLFFLNKTHKYIVNTPSMNLGKLVSDHFITGKKAPAYYMQAGDDFYRMSRADPLELGDDIPILSGIGDFKIRVTNRHSISYEVVPELKIKNLKPSKYSVAPGTKKINPFLQEQA